MGFPGQSRIIHKKTPTKSTKTGSASQWRTSVFAQAVQGKKQEKRLRGGASFGVFDTLDFSSEHSRVASLALRAIHLLAADNAFFGAAEIFTPLGPLDWSLVNARRMEFDKLEFIEKF